VVSCPLSYSQRAAPASYVAVDQCVLTVLKVLKQLPEGLVMAVLTASAADVEHHLFVLPSSLHPLAIEVAFPSIRRDRSLTLDFASLRKSSTACVVLHAATAGTAEASSLHALDLKPTPSDLQ
jgi:hypothetical protein